MVPIPYEAVRRGAVQYGTERYDGKCGVLVSVRGLQAYQAFGYLAQGMLVTGNPKLLL